KAEFFANIRAHRYGPSVGRICRPIESDEGVTVDEPSALEVVTEFRLQKGLVHAPPVAVSSERHQVVSEDAIEPWTLRVDERRCWTGRPPSSAKIGRGGCGKLKDRPDAPEPLVGVARGQEEGGLQVLETIRLMRTGPVGHRKTWLDDQIPCRV